MKLKKVASRALIWMAFTGGMLLSSSLGNALPVSCPGTLAITTDREFTLDTAVDSVCLASGVGSLSGSGDAINLLTYLTLDKSNDTVSGLLAPNVFTIIAGSLTAGNAGSFSFSAPGFKDFVLGFDVGQIGDLNPDWAAFLIPNGITSVLWAVTGKQTLSHVVLYGKVDPRSGTTVVPLPAALPLLLIGLGGLTWLSRRRKA